MEFGVIGSLKDCLVNSVCGVYRQHLKALAEKRVLVWKSKSCVLQMMYVVLMVSSSHNFQCTLRCFTAECGMPGMKARLKTFDFMGKDNCFPQIKEESPPQAEEFKCQGLLFVAFGPNGLRSHPQQWRYLVCCSEETVIKGQSTFHLSPVVINYGS